MDRLCGLWTNVGRFTMNRASPVSHHLSLDPHVSDQCRGPTYQPRFSSNDAMLTSCRRKDRASVGNFGNHSDHLGDLADHFDDLTDHVGELSDHFGDLSDHPTNRYTTPRPRELVIV